MKISKGILLLIVGCNAISAATRTADGCSAAAVQNMINRSARGDTVLIPGGTCTWKTGVFDTIGVYLQGAGMGRTVIKDSMPSSGSGLLIFKGDSINRSFGLRDLSIKYGNQFAKVYVTGTSRSWRISHVEIDSVKNRTFFIVGYTYGVIDNCVFNMGMGIDCIYVRGDNITSWHRPLSLGTSNAVYIEDCTFNYPVHNGIPLNDCESGGRYVFRWCTFRNTWIAQHDMQLTGGPGGGLYDGTFSFEIYHNRYIADAETYCIASLRGGTGVIHDNTATGTWDFGLTVNNYRSVADRYWPPPQDTCNGHSSWDGNEDSTGYPCRQQTGRTFTVGKWAGTADSSIQDSVPVYQWNNLINGNPATWHIVGGPIKVGRDVITGRPPQYSEFTYPHPLAPGDKTNQDYKPKNLIPILKK
jgi:hypothetical protein